MITLYFKGKSLSLDQKKGVTLKTMWRYDFFQMLNSHILRNSLGKMGWVGLFKHGAWAGGEIKNNRFFSKGVYLLK